VSLAWIQNPRREVACEECPGGAIVGASQDLGHVPAAAVTPARA
jgi:hypothetical protein